VAAGRGNGFFLFMAKRFIDTDIFKKRSMRDLEAPYKLLFIYLFTDCNHAGIWEVDMEVANIRTGNNISEQDAIEKLGDNIMVINGGDKWFLTGFIEFQYGDLNPENRAHKSVIDQLIKYQIKQGAYKGLTRPLQGCKDKDMDKDIVKVKDKIEVSKKFYTEEMESNQGGEHYELYVKFITYLFKNNPTKKPCNWLNLEHQVTYKQFTNLLKLAGSLENLHDKVDIGINKPSYLTGKKVMHTTLKNWMK